MTATTPTVPRAAADIIWERLATPDACQPDWRKNALCAQTDPEAFFPDKGGSIRAAKQVFRSCEVRLECLDYALTHDERFGIWGGKSERERRALRRARRDGARR